jgi:HEAT repeat protein
MLGTMRSENAVPLLLATLDNDRSREVRIAAAIALCDLDALPPLDVALGKIGIAGQRSRRLIELFRRLPAERMPELKDCAARTDAAPFVRVAVIDALARSGDFRLAGFYGNIAQSGPAEVTAAAIRAIGRTGHPSAVAILFHGLEHEDWGVRCAAAEAAGQLGLPDLAAPLARLLDDETWTVRYAAAKAMSAIVPEGERILREIAANQSSRSQRTASLILAEGPIP